MDLRNSLPDFHSNYYVFQRDLSDLEEYILCEVSVMIRCEIKLKKLDPVTVNSSDHGAIKT